MNFFLSNEQSTLLMGRKLAECLCGRGVIFLRGPLGAGKTTLVRGLLNACGHLGSTKSPTYTIVEPYQVDSRKFYHFDLYRIADPEELEYMGFRDYLDEEAMCLIEWPEKGADFLPSADLEITLAYENGARRISFEFKNKAWKDKFSQLVDSELEQAD